LSLAPFKTQQFRRLIIESLSFPDGGMVPMEISSIEWSRFNFILSKSSKITPASEEFVWWQLVQLFKKIDLISIEKDGSSSQGRGSLVMSLSQEIKV